MNNRDDTKGVVNLEQKLVLGVALFVLAANMSIASESTRGISAIKEVVSLEVSRHPAVNSQKFMLAWRDFPPSLPSCSRAVTKEIVFHPADADSRPSRVALKLECSGVPRWTRYLRAQITYQARVETLTAVVPKGSRFDKGLVQGGENGNSTELSQYEGRVARRDLRIGSELRLNDWEPITVIRKGERVSVTLVGPGFEIETEGEALGDAGLNDRVQIKLPNGTRVGGIVVAEKRVVVERV